MSTRVRSSERFPRPYGKYELLERIGDGGMAEVFRARLPGAAGFEKIVVIKRILPHLAGDPRVVEMFVAEAKLAARVQHKNIVSVYELGELEDGEFFIVMEHVDGTDLARLLRSAARASLRLPVWFSLHVMSEVLEGLGFAHELTDDAGKPRNVVHRDVTPSNIFLSRLGEVKLGDFGVAKDDSRTSFTRTGAIKGKVAYMSPEQLYGQRLDRRTDVFAAATLLWELLTQRRLFGGRPDIETMNLISKGQRPPPSLFNPEVPPILDGCVLAALEIDRERRTESAQALLGSLNDVLDAMRPRVRQADVRKAIEILLGTQAPEQEFHGAGAPADVPREQTFYESTPDDSEERLATVPQVVPGELRASDIERLLEMPGQLSLAEDSSSSERWVAPDLELMLQQRAVLPPAPAPMPSPASLAGDLLDPPPARPPPRRPPPGEVDVESLVADAVESVKKPDVGSHVEPLPEHSLLQGIEIHKHANKLAELAAASWANQGILGDAYNGDHPFWARDEDGNTIGPCSYKQLIFLVKSEARTGKSLAVSADKQQWMTTADLAVLTGQELLLERSDAEPPKKGLFSGLLHQRSLTAIFGGLARDQNTGRLIIVDEGSGKFARREVHVLQGKPTFVYANAEALQLPHLMIEKRLVSQELLPEVMHQVVLQKKSLEQAVAERSHLDVAQHLPVFMKERLVDIFGWRAGRYVFDATTPPARTVPFARSLLQVLPEMVHRSMSTEDLRAALLRDLEAKLEVSQRFEQGLRELNLTPVQIDVARRLKGRRIGQFLKSYPEQEKLFLTIAYVLLETDLLLRPVSR